MGDGVPARDTLEGWAVNPPGACLWCGARGGSDLIGLHHDHLMDFALVEMRRSAPAGSSATDVDCLWKAQAGEFREVLRFDPAWVCQHCNNGDGWGKFENWCGAAAGSTRRPSP